MDEQLAVQMPGGIYQIRNTVNGKRYVGSAENLVRRESAHWTNLRRGAHHSAHLQRAWNKYGEKNFEFLVVGRCAPERLVDLEQEVIDHLKPEYNINPTAGSSLGIRRIEETRRKMSEAKMGNTNALGHIQTEEHRRKLSKTQMGRIHTEEIRHKISEALMGHVVTEKTRRKISKAKMGNTYALGRVHTEEDRRKMSESQKRRRAKEKIV